jgi:hypothetical protein
MDTNKFYNIFVGAETGILKGIFFESIAFIFFCFELCKCK